MSNDVVQYVAISDLIELDERVNQDAVHYPVLGLNKDKQFMPTVADTSHVDLRKYKIVRKDEFAFSGMQTGRDMCIRIAYYNKDEPALISPAYTTFRLKRDLGTGGQVLPEFLFMFFNRDESDRYGAFISDSSVRANLDWSRFIQIQIPVPSIESQMVLTEVWKRLRVIVDSNQTLEQPLMDLCMSYLKGFQTQYPMKRLGDGLIERIERTNEDMKLLIEHVRGVSNTKEIIKTKANISKRDLSKFLVLNTHEFVYNRRTTRNGERLGMGFNEGKAALLFTEDYVAFRVSDTAVLLPEYLFLCFKRDEFDRYARWDSWGSATEFFNWENMQQVKIPVPPLEKQQALVSLYKCARKCQQIARRAADLAKAACPALVKKAKEM